MRQHPIDAVARRGAVLARRSWLRRRGPGGPNRSGPTSRRPAPGSRRPPAARGPPRCGPSNARQRRLTASLAGIRSCRATTAGPDCATAGFPGRPERLPRPWPPPPPSPSPATRPPSRILPAAGCCRRAGRPEVGADIPVRPADHDSVGRAGRGARRAKKGRGGEGERGRLRRRCPRRISPSPPLPLSPSDSSCLSPLLSPLVRQLRQDVFQPGQAGTAVGLNGHDGDAELPLEAGQIDANPAAGGHVEHVQGQHGRQPQLEHLADEIEIALEIAGVDDRIRPRRPARLLPAGPTADRPPPFRRATGARGCTGPADRSPRTAGRRGSSGRLSFPQSRRDSCRRADGRRPAR